MNKTMKEADAFKKEIMAKLGEEVALPETVIFPPATLIATLKGNGVFATGAQNISAEDFGAFTGELAAEHFIDLKCEYAIVGHSERRKIYKEDDELINRKLKKCIDSRITPILCVGERMKERQQGRTMAKIEFQIEAAFAGLTAIQARKVVVAYEPIWAIGTGETATSAQAEEVCFAIRKKIVKLYDSGVADEIPILYGGSVTAANASELLSKPNINGVLVGGASLKAEEFSQIVLAGR